MSYRLLIIDPQNDFHEGGNLAVAGAKQDSRNIVALVKAKSPQKVFVSLDTHTLNHIGHSGYWNPPAPTWTSFSVVNGEVKGSDGKTYTSKKAELAEWTVKYVEELTAAGKFTPLIWPTHCIETEPGHKVFGELKTALDAFGNNVEYHIKGQNEATEMYSIFKAEKPAPVEIYTPDLEAWGSQPPSKSTSKIDTDPTSKDADKPDGSYLKTDMNTALADSVAGDDQSVPIAVCGEALSHCVNWSTRDLSTYLRGKGVTNPIVVLIDASSPVGGFNANALAFFKFCSNNNIYLMTTGQFVEYLDGKLKLTKNSMNNEALKKNTALGGDVDNLRKDDELWAAKGLKGGARKTRRSKHKKGRKTRGRKH